MRRILVIEIILPIFIILFAAIYFYSRNEWNSSLRTTEAGLSLYVSNKADELSSLLSTMTTEVNGLALLLSLPQTDCRDFLLDKVTSHPELIALSIAYDSEFLKDFRGGMYPEYLLQSNSMLEDVGQTPEKLNYVVWRNADGKINRQNSERQSYPTHDWYIMAKKFRRGVWAEPQRSIMDGTSFVVPFGMPFFYKGRFAGALCAVFDIKRVFTNHVGDNIDLSDIKGRIMLLNLNGNILFQSSSDYERNTRIYSLVNELRREEMYPLLDRILSGAAGSVRLPDWGDGISGYGEPQDVRIVFAPVGQRTGLVVAAGFHEEDLHAAIHHRLIFLWLGGLLTMLLVIAVTIFVVLRIYNPVYKMAVISGQIASGDMDVRLPKRYLRRLSIIGMLAHNFNLMTENLNYNIQMAAEEKARRTKLEGQLSVTQQIQESLRPRRGFLNGWDKFDLEATLVPAQYVAGDFYDYWQIDDERIALLVGDVSGKGIPASLVMVAIRTLIRQISSKRALPNEVLNEVNRYVQMGNERMMFATLYYAEYNTVTGKLIYCNAGHNPPALLRADGTVQWQARSENTVLGIFPDGEFHSQEDTLAENESLFLFTDGVTDSRMQNGEIYGEDRLKTLLGKVAGESLHTMVDMVKDVLITYSGNDQADDITIMVLRRKPSNPPNEADGQATKR